MFPWTCHLIDTNLLIFLSIKYLSLHPTILPIKKQTMILSCWDQKRIFGILQTMKHTYFEVSIITHLWEDISWPTWFTLVIYDFGIKYYGSNHFEHLFNILSEDDKISVDLNEDLYCGKPLAQNYNKHNLNLHAWINKETDPKI